MDESTIIQKLIQVGQMFERGQLEWCGAEIDIKYYLKKYIALHQHLSIHPSCEQEKCRLCGEYTEQSGDDELCDKCFSMNNL